jgi:transposase
MTRSWENLAYGNRPRTDVQQRALASVILAVSHRGGHMDDQERARWTKLVADYETSDLTQREFATERGISYSNLRNWIYRLRKESRPLASEPASASRQAPARAAPPKVSRLLPVRVVASAAKPRRTAVAAGAGDELLELALPSGVRVRFPAGTDLKYLRALATAL